MPAFSPNEFGQYPLVRQAQILFDQGRELMSRMEGDYILRLFALEEFYVEVWYLPTLNKINKVEIVNMDEVMADYEDEIDIRDAYR